MENLTKVNIFDKMDKLNKLYEYNEIAQMNDHMINLVKVENRTLDFHVHKDSDEVFYILDGAMQLEFSDSIVDLVKGDVIVVPKGTSHRPICTVPVTVLLIEQSGTLNAQNSGGTYK